MTNVLKQLQRPSWREIEFPVSHRDYGFRQAQASHRFIFVDNQLIESLGRDSPTYRYTIPFREDVTGGGWTNLFTVVYPDFLAACQDRSRGVLTDPLHGSLPAKCVSLAEILDINRTDGIEVEAEFIHAPTETDFVNNLGTVIRTLEGAKAYAMRFDAQVAAVDFPIREAPEPTVNPLDLPATLSSQADVASNRVTAAFGDSALRAERAAASIDRLRNPSLAPQAQQARRLQESLLALEDRIDPTGARPLRKVTTTSGRTVSALARLLNIPLRELLRLNPALSRPENTPFVKAGIQVRVFADTLSDPANGRR